MKKLFLLLYIFSMSAFSKPILVLSAFEPFRGASFNNSEKIANLLLEDLKNDSDFPVEVKYCLLPTVFDKGEARLSECVSEFRGQELVGVISLGEAACKLKLETMATNYDKNDKRSYPDNEGNQRNAPIINGGSDRLSFSLPVDKLFCELTPEEKKISEVSTDTGSFVCNNTAYLFSYNNPDLSYHFIHTPAFNCPNLESANVISKNIIKKFILLSYETYINKLTHSFPVTKRNAKIMAREASGCYKNFYEELKKLLRD